MPARIRRPSDQALQQLRELSATPQSERDLVWYHQVGEQVDQHHPGTREEAYSRRLMAQLAETVGGG